MKEIGGYFGLEEFTGEEYYPALTAVNSARGALLYILKARQVKKLYLPHFLCDSVFELCRREGYPCEFYSVGEDFMPRLDMELREGEYLYAVNYYGQLDDRAILAIKAKHGNIILDNVQAFFQKPLDGIDTVYSCRKYFGVPDGGYAATDAQLTEPFPQDVSMDRLKHLVGRYEGKSAADYYEDFKENDRLLDHMGLRGMSKLTHNLLRAIDYAAVKKRREENFALLHAQLGRANRLKLKMPEGPFAYPCYCENGMEMKRKLAEQKIYVPTLWPNALGSSDSAAREYAENILPLPCDQRYAIEEIWIVLDAIAEMK